MSRASTARRLRRMPAKAKAQLRMQLALPAIRCGKCGVDHAPLGRCPNSVAAVPSPPSAKF
jgi:hypothetical protein